MQWTLKVYCETYRVYTYSKSIIKIPGNVHGLFPSVFVVDFVQEFIQKDTGSALNSF